MGGRVRDESREFRWSRSTSELAKRRLSCSASSCRERAVDELRQRFEGLATEARAGRLVGMQQRDATRLLGRRRRFRMGN